MPPIYDAMVIGLGAMGSAAAFHLSRRGHSVLGLDQFTPPHTHGSSHGQTRIIREAYFEHPCYVPIVQRAYTLWAELEKTAGVRLFHQTGGLMFGPPDSAIVTGARRSAIEHHLSHEILEAPEIRRRFPALHPDNNMVGVHEPRAGVLFPERCIAAHLAAARRHGADLRCERRVVRWEPAANEGIRVFTGSSPAEADSFVARSLIVTAGAWVSRLFPDLRLPFQVERQILYWFEPARNAAAFQPEQCPIYIGEMEGSHHFYGFPEMGEGVKIARHHDGQATDPDALNREVSAGEIQEMREIVRRFLPDADGLLRQTAVCLYTNTPDHHFWLDRHPDHPQVIVASPCSGHGFKFSSAIGEILADWAAGRQPRFDLDLFRARESRGLR